MADVKKTYTIPSAIVAEMIEVFGQGYQEQIHDTETNELVDNPQTKPQYASEQFDRTVIGIVKQRVQSYRRNKALQVVEQDFGIIAG